MGKFAHIEFNVCASFWAYLHMRKNGAWCVTRINPLASDSVDDALCLLVL